MAVKKKKATAKIQKPKIKADIKQRSSGLLMHLSSLPGPCFNGDMGQAAYDFVDFLAASGQKWWQMLPVNPVGPGYSPYSTISSFAGESLFISLNDLVERGLLRAAEIKAPAKGAAERVDYKQAQIFRERLLRLAFERAGANAGSKAGFFTSTDFLTFKRREASWLEDFSLFGAISAKYKTTDWAQWPDALKRREPAALHEAATSLAAERLYLEFTQYIFDAQWQALKSYAASQGVGLIGDLPIFVGYKSADVWAHRQYFLLDKSLIPTYVAGCPPDAFNADGQLWGNALYDWPTLQKNGFDWWLARLDKMLSQFDAVRLDHFIGFYRYWRIPAKAKTAREGTWQLACGEAFFKAVQKRFPSMPFIAEDLGAVIPPVRELRDQFELPGMKVLQFGFDGSDEARQHQAHNFSRASAVYTGTHDNHTTVGWFADLKKRASRDPKAKQELALVRAYFGTEDRDIAVAMRHVAMQSPGALCVTPVQDLLSLGGSHRMNVPGTARGNWSWRVPKKQLTAGVAADLLALTMATDRL